MKQAILLTAMITTILNWTISNIVTTNIVESAGGQVELLSKDSQDLKRVRLDNEILTALLEE